MYATRFTIECSQRYHAHRRSFFDGLHKATMFGVVLTGSVAFSKLVGQPEWFGGAAAVLAAADMVFGYSHKARDHEMLYRRCMGLAAEFHRKEATNEQLNTWKGQIEEIFADEPPVYRALHAISHNECVIAHDQDPKNLIDLKLRHRLFFNFWRFRNVSLRTRDQLEQEKSSKSVSSAPPSTSVSVSATS